MPAAPSCSAIADVSKFIEIGHSLRISDKVPPKTLVVNANARLRAAIPRAIETFHQALDDIETDIVGAHVPLKSKYRKLMNISRFVQRQYCSAI